MKKSIIFLFSMILSIMTFGQIQGQKLLEEVKVSPPKFDWHVQEATAFSEEKHGEIGAYIQENIEYPADAFRHFIEGTQVVQFTVTPAGKLTNFNMINSLSPLFDDEIIRVLKNTDGLWIPGTNNGEPVAMDAEISVIFKLDRSDQSDLSVTQDFTKTARKYFAKGGTLLFLKDKPKRALNYYDRGIVLLPNEPNLLLMRGLTRYELNDSEGACKDWNRLKALGGVSSDVYLENYCEMKGYAELVRILEE